jgi:hypothetical protein
MKKQVIKIFSMLSLAVTLTVAAVYANPTDTLKANIPFDFSVGNKTLPGGVYTVRPITSTGMLRIRREDGREAVMIQTNGVIARQAQDQTKLVFRRYGNKYFLVQIWTAGDSNGRELWKSRTERELIKKGSNYLAKNVVEPEVVCIVAE